VKLLANPLFLRMVVVSVAAAVAFLIGMVLIRRMRRRLTEEASFGPEPASEESLPLHAFQAVIQELKQEKFQLQNQHEMERRRAKATEGLNAAVMGYLSSGVMLLGTNGLVRQANAAAKQILGYASPSGLSAPDIFREAILLPSSASSGGTVVEAIQASVQQKSPFQRLETQYTTPAGEQRVLEMTLTTLHAPEGAALGAACLINDRSEIARMRRQEELRGEMSAELALELRNSLSTISDCAQKLAASREAEAARQLAADIAAEAARLEHTIGGFLAGAKAAAS
jgi:two-component system, NtrC family, sensor histidine kinase PilS